MRLTTLMLTGFFCLSVVAQTPAADVILNEYNAVSGNNRLDDGDGRDPFFGTIFGNGGNWIELLVVEDNTDMRGWTLSWAEDETVDGGATAAGTLTLANADTWSDLRSGTIITFIETIDAGAEDGFDTSTDTSFDPASDDWWINVSTREEATKGADALVTTVTNDGNTGDFSVGKDDWTLTIADATSSVIFGPVGEGASWAGGGVKGEEGGSLEGPTTENGLPVTIELWRAITPASEFYDDTGSTSFGQPNQDYNEATQQFSLIQDLSALRDPSPPLGNGDFDSDGQLTAADMDALTAQILAGGTDLSFDVDLNGTVDQQDREAWVHGLRNTFFGDGNLDGEFETGDLVGALAAGGYEDDVIGNSGWAGGDWDGDGEFTTSDLVAGLADGGFEQGPRAAVAAVPEPAGAALLIIGLLTLGHATRCSRRRTS